MPIRFPCPHCRQKLSISSRKAGTSAVCPRCQKGITVPAPTRTAAATSAATPSADESEEEHDDNPYSQFAVFDEEELVYESSAAVSSAQGSTGLDERIAVPRYVLLVQGVLLGVVALVAFALGLLVGGGFYAQPVAVAGQPCKVQGTVSYASGGATLPDAGAVIMFLPQTKDPGRRLAAQGLRPEDPLGQAPLAGAEELRNMGGAYARADEQGRFEVQLADPGTYFVLFLSGNSRRQAGQDVQTQDLVKISRFVDGASDLLADSRYQFSTETVQGDRELSAVFD